MNTYYLRELRKEAFHIYKIVKLLIGTYAIIDTRFPNAPITLKIETLEEAMRKLKMSRNTYIMIRHTELLNEKRFKWL